MAWGAAAYLKNGEEVVTRYAPYNFIKHVPVKYVNGTHSFTVSELPSYSSMTVSIDAYAAGASKGSCRITSLSVSGNRVTYTVEEASYGTPTNQAFSGNYLAFGIYARR